MNKNKTNNLNEKQESVPIDMIDWQNVATLLKSMIRNMKYYLKQRKRINFYFELNIKSKKKHKSMKYIQTILYNKTRI